VIRRYASTESDPRARGFGFGRELRAEIASTIAAYDRLFESAAGLSRDEVGALGELAGRALDRRAPEPLEEMRGIAAGAEVAEASILALNARTEILAGRGRAECSVIGVAGDRSGGHCLLAQNWDWHPDLAGSLVLWTVSDAGGRTYTTLTEAGILAKVGFNDRGVGLCLNILHSSSDGGVDGTPVHVLCRRILSEAGTVGDAARILEAAKATASSCFNVACAGDGGTSMSSFELSPSGLGRVEAEDGVLLHTNHFIAPLPGADDVLRRDYPDSGLRLDELEARLRADRSPIDAERIKDALRSHEIGPVAICCHDAENPAHDERLATLASVVMDLGEGRVEITDGAPCMADYETAEVTGA
jgi:isopenicillin-N N-acyltransferase like protein